MYWCRGCRTILMMTFCLSMASTVTTRRPITTGSELRLSRAWSLGRDRLKDGSRNWGEVVFEKVVRLTGLSELVFIRARRGGDLLRTLEIVIGERGKARYRSFCRVRSPFGVLHGQELLGIEREVVRGRQPIVLASQRYSYTRRSTFKD